MEIARKRNLLVIEDCAESHGATCRGRMTGSFGDMACFSFYANKVITTGEGGMVTTNNRNSRNVCVCSAISRSQSRASATKKLVSTFA